MRQKVVTVSDKSRTSYEKCRKTKGKSTWAKRTLEQIAVCKRRTHTRAQSERDRERHREPGGWWGHWPARQRRDAIQKAKAMPKEDKT